MFTQFWKTHGEKIISIAKGAAIACIGAGITYLLQSLSATHIDPAYVPAELAVISTLVNALRKFGIPVAKLYLFGAEL